MSASPLSRRRFIAQSGLAAASSFGFPAIVSCKSPNAEYDLVFIGAGGRAAGNIKELTGISPGAGTPKGKPGAGGKTKQPETPSTADIQVPRRTWGRALQHERSEPRRGFIEISGVKTFRDFRQLYDKLKDTEFDAVVVSTCEHTHAYATLPALLRKKAVYCEKPLTRDVQECLIREAAEKAGVATQMGTQIHGMPNYRRVVELIQSGAID